MLAELGLPSDKNGRGSRAIADFVGRNDLMTVQVAPPIQAAELVPNLTPAKEHVMRKISGGSLFRGVAGRVFWPGHLWKAFSLHRHRKANRRKFDDTRLALYSQILPSDFLHYGFF